MFDLGTSFVASVERDPDALAIVDGSVRLTYREWLDRISTLAGILQAHGVARGDHVVSILQNSWQAATLHWACQFVGAILTPINWRATADEFGYVLDDSGARLALYEPIAADAVTGACAHRNVVGINVEELDLTQTANVVTPVASASDWSSKRSSARSTS